MAVSKVIATTWTKDKLLAKLKATLKRMDEEIDAWEKDQASLKKRQEAWEKKAIAVLKKSLNKASETTINHHRTNSVALVFEFDKSAMTSLGEYPENTRKPQYKETGGYYSRNQDLSEYEQVENAIALIKDSEDTTFKITSTSAWAQFIR